LTRCQEIPVRLTTVFGLAFLVACSDANDPGDPLPLTPESLEGRWVKFQVVRSTVTEPVLSDTTEIPENGEIYEFTASGDVHYFCRCPGGAEGGSTPQYTSYSIAGDTLLLYEGDYPPQRLLAKVTTRRLIFGGGPGTTPFDITGDGVPENVTVADIYRQE
jgi:hypothetical protein